MKNKNTEHTVILVFLKAPVKGFVKTRLAKIIGDDAALESYQCFVKHTLDILSQTDYTVYVYFYPAHRKAKVKELVGNEIPLFPQKGDHLGTRMKNAMDDAFSKGFTKAILIGTDIPGLSRDIIDDAVMNLDQDQAVIGPSSDGGYYLIGFHFRGFIPDIFFDMPWGTSRVLQQTASMFKAKKMHVVMLNRCRDIDTFEDLQAFLSEEKTNQCNDILKKIIPGVFR